MHKHPPTEAGARYVALAGGADALLAQAQTAFDQGDYRWVAELVNHLVFAEPDNIAARTLQADALEQMGYQAESGPWRAFYLTGAQELRNPMPKSAKPRQSSAGQLRALPAGSLLEALAVRLNGDEIGVRTFAFNLTFTETDEVFSLSVRNGVMHHAPGRSVGPAAEVSLTYAALVALLIGETTMADAMAAGTVSGETSDFEDLLGLLDRFDFWFAIIEP